ncbi:MAG: hypothetical protein K0S27_367 [Gammaproteobacteria bacterium]|jgi:hypothetical protein|nr:hypothetical protein [Gammaproteobacteria bacterium]
MHTKNKNLIALLLLNSFFTTAHAIGPGFYMGAQVGSTNLHNTTQTVQTGLSSPPTVPVSPTNTGMGERLFMGAVINKYAAAEVGYTHYGPSTYKPSPSALSNTPSISENGVDLVGEAMYPFKNVALLGKLGVISIKQTRSGSLQPLPPAQSSGSSQHVRPLIGIGASYEINPNWVTDLSWTRALKGGGGFQNADFIAVGLSYHFVDKYCGQFLC